jgi:hypothetical protein
MNREREEAKDEHTKQMLALDALRHQVRNVARVPRLHCRGDTCADR